jgi:hypothetical protein
MEDPELQQDTAWKGDLYVEFEGSKLFNATRTGAQEQITNTFTFLYTDRLPMSLRLSRRLPMQKDCRHDQNHRQAQSTHPFTV